MDLACLVIADDLTGACDAAVQFAIAGLRVRVSLDGAAPSDGIDVLAVSTESRDAGLASFRIALENLKSLNPHIVFKKIDSTMRGNVGPEVAAAREAFGCTCAIVTPAFPAMGRLVGGGYLHLAGQIGFVPYELAAAFRDLPDCPVDLRDAACDSDLDAIVAEGFGRSGKILWAGSAGLAAALARSLGRSGGGFFGFDPLPPLFCLGSNHPVTLEQQRRLTQERSVELFDAQTATAEDVIRAMRRGPAVLRVERGCARPDCVAEILRFAKAPLVLCGGDTASLVCRTIGVQAIDLAHEISPGIPAGRLVGGPFHGMPVVTKSGGFGGPDALIEVADFFSCFPQLH